MSKMLLRVPDGSRIFFKSHVTKDGQNCNLRRKAGYLETARALCDRGRQ